VLSAWRWHFVDQRRERTGNPFELVASASSARDLAQQAARQPGRGAAPGRPERTSAALSLRLREQERARLARELQQQVAHSLTALKMRLAAMAGAGGPRNGVVRLELQETIKLIDSLQRSIGDTASGLRSVVLAIVPRHRG
jgi:signal transduction histidine kinase